MNLPPNFSPFREASTEPRFAFDFSFCTVEAISLSLDLLRYCRYAGPESRFHAVGGESGWLAVSTTASPSRLTLGVPYFSDLPQEEAARRVLDWLEETEYPPQPWFEGGESRGFAISHVPWEAEPAVLYGYTVVQPKWFEVHK
jgi:hypothetical protein